MTWHSHDSLCQPDLHKTFLLNDMLVGSSLKPGKKINISSDRQKTQCFSLKDNFNVEVRLEETHQGLLFLHVVSDVYKVKDSSGCRYLKRHDNNNTVFSGI